MTSENVALIAGILVSAVFELYPAAKVWFDKLSPAQKFLLMSGAGALVVAGAFGLACGNLFNLGNIYSCDKFGAEKAVGTWVTYFVSNQTTYGVLNTARKQLQL